MEQAGGLHVGGRGAEGTAWAPLLEQAPRPLPGARARTVADARRSSPPIRAHALPQVIREFGYLVRCITAREAVNLGIFMSGVLALVERWKVGGEGGRPACLGVGRRASKAWGGTARRDCRAMPPLVPTSLTDPPPELTQSASTYERECAGTDAFQTWQGDKRVPITYQQYCNLCYNWQKVGAQHCFGGGHANASGQAAVGLGFGVFVACGKIDGLEWRA